jgi:hypothetical protein
MSKIYSFIVVTAGENRPGYYDYQTLFSTRSDKEYEAMKATLTEQHFGLKRESYARNRREIIVTGVDRKVHEEYQHSAGRNGETSKPTHRGQRFPSAAAASGHLGLLNNEVAIMLSRSTLAGKKDATVRGVTLAYADENS